MSVFLSSPTELFSGAVWAEGPVYLPGRDAVLFSDVKANKKWLYDNTTGQTTEFISDVDFSNGNALLTKDVVVSCSHGSRGIFTTDLNTKQVTKLTDSFCGKRLNSPNDLVVKSDGTVWFTDPPYGILSNGEGYQAPSETIGCWVYVYHPTTQQTTLATYCTMRPNGLFFSPDESKLYVADMSIVEFDQGTHKLVEFDVVGHKAVNPRDLCQVKPGIPDGFCVDTAGRIYCSCEDGVIVFDAQGKQLDKLVLGKCVSNCTLGGPKQNLLYVTATNSLYVVEVAGKGFQYDKL